ncbi:MAG TPA: prenyltransferase [Ktedonosporobacter sp.]|jgi:1,4-dihydroxy-2-naphthoate octaprenyltransferase|nr:prenyltransferase [Ktedonosporobacter sp.]
MNRFNLFLQVTRARTLPVMIAPVAIGSLLAWAQGTPFHWGLFLVTLLGAISAHLAANVTNDVFDFKAGTDQAAQGMVGEGATFVTGSQPLINGQLSPGHYRTIALVLFLLSLLCGVALTFFRPWSLAFGVAGFLLAFFYVAPPLRLAYVGRGIGELDIFFSFGLLPLVGSYYVQAGAVTLTALLAALPVGLYTTAVLYFHHFLHWRADTAVGKITPVVALGEQRARLAGALLLLLIAATFFLDALLQVYPWYSAIAALTVLPVLFALQRARGDLENYLKLMAANSYGNLQAAVLLLIALLIRGSLRI